MWQVYMNPDLIFPIISYGIKFCADVVIFWSTLKKTFNSYFERNTILQKNFSLNQQQVFFPCQKRTWHIKHCKAKLHLYNYVTPYDSVSEIILLHCTSCSHVALNYFKSWTLNGYFTSWKGSLKYLCRYFEKYPKAVCQICMSILTL